MKNIFDLSSIDECMEKAKKIIAKMEKEYKGALRDGEDDFISINEKDLDFVVYAFEKYYFSKYGTLLGGEYPTIPKKKINRVAEIAKAITGKKVE